MKRRTTKNKNEAVTLELRLFIYIFFLCFSFLLGWPRMPAPHLMRHPKILLFMLYLLRARWRLWTPSIRFYFYLFFSFLFCSLCVCVCASVKIRLVAHANISATTTTTNWHEQRRTIWSMCVCERWTCIVSFGFYASLSIDTIDRVWWRFHCRKMDSTELTHTHTHDEWQTMESHFWHECVCLCRCDRLTSRSTTTYTRHTHHWISNW